MGSDKPKAVGRVNGFIHLLNHLATPLINLLNCFYFFHLLHVNQCQDNVFNHAKDRHGICQHEAYSLMEGNHPQD